MDGFCEAEATNDCLLAAKLKLPVSTDLISSMAPIPFWRTGPSARLTVASGKGARPFVGSVDVP